MNYELYVYRSAVRAFAFVLHASSAVAADVFLTGMAVVLRDGEPAVCYEQWIANVMQGADREDDVEYSADGHES